MGGAKDKGADLAENAVDAVRARPLASTGVVAAIAMFLAREPLIGLAGKLAGKEARKRWESRGPKPNGPNPAKWRVTMTENDQDSSPRQRAIEAYESARDGVTDASRKAVDTFAEAPLIALAGGIAAGALIAALLPRTDGEARLIRPASRKVRDTARAAYGPRGRPAAASSTSSGSPARTAKAACANCSKASPTRSRASADAALDAARKRP